MKPTPLPSVLDWSQSGSGAASEVRRVSDVIRLDGASVPKLAVSIDTLRAAQLDHRAGFLLSLIDGATDLETILDVCGMPHQEAIALLGKLERRGFVTWHRS